MMELLIAVSALIVICWWGYYAITDNQDVKRRAELEAKWARRDAQWDARERLRVEREKRLPLAERIRDVQVGNTNFRGRNHLGVE